jgi:putative transposase
VIYCYSRRVVGFAVAGHMRTDLIIDALRMAIIHRNPPPGVIFHSDRGAQYTSTEFRGFCRTNDVRPSVGRTGICYDNAVAESFSATLKKELIHVHPWPDIDTLRVAVFEYIESYYNRRRRHSTIGYDTPMEYEHKYALNQLQVA